MTTSAVSEYHRCLHHGTLQTRRRSQAKPRIADDDRRLERHNEVGRNSKIGKIGKIGRIGKIVLDCLEEVRG